MTCIWDFYYKLEDKTKNLTEETDITDMTAQRLVDCTETMEPSRAWMESLSPDAHGYLSPWTHHNKSALRQRFSRAKGEREIDIYNYYYYFFFLSFECVDHWRCQTCVQCTKFPPLKVKQMEAELWSHLSALKAEIEENRGAGSSNAYRFVCDVLFKLRLPKG